MPVWGWFMLGTAAVSFFGGWEVRGWRDDSAALATTKAQIQAVADADKKAFDGFQLQNNITLGISKTLVETHEVITQRTIETIKEVTKYVTPEASDACIVPLGFVRLFNLKAAGLADSDAAFPYPAGTDANTPTSIDLAAVASAITENDGKYHGIAADRLAVIDWVREQQAAHK